MIPLLFPADAIEFPTLGIGALGHAKDITVTWQANSTYVLQMEYPINGPRYADLADRRIILATAGPDESPQPFRIYRMVPTLLGSVTVYAEHVHYDLKGCTVSPFTANSLAETMQQLQSGAVTVPHPFVFDTDMESSVVCKVTTPRAIWSMLGGHAGSIPDTYGRGEWDFDGFRATLRKRLGGDNGVVIRYGKNLQSLQQDRNLANVWTGVHPFWADTAGNVVTLPEKILHADGEFDYSRILPLDLSTNWAEPPTEEQLRTAATKYMEDNEIGKPAVSLDVGFAPLDQTEEYKGKNYLSKIHKGDTVSVVFPTRLDPDTETPTAFVTSSARAVKTVWKPLLDRYERVYLGSVRTSFSKIVAQNVAELTR